MFGCDGFSASPKRERGRGGFRLDLRTNYGALSPMDENKDREPILNVKFYKSETGKEPVREWLKELPKADRQTIGEDIKTTQYG